MKKISWTIACCAALGMGGCANDGESGIPAHSPPPEPERETIWDLFNNDRDPFVTINVNKYLWNAALDTLSFLPVETADPFSGLIITGYGRPPGGSQAFRVAVQVAGPQMDAAVLRVAIHKSGGVPASAETIRNVKDAILTRARQMRIAAER